MQISNDRERRGLSGGCDAAAIWLLGQHSYGLGQGTVVTAYWETTESGWVKRAVTTQHCERYWLQLAVILPVSFALALPVAVEFRVKSSQKW